MALFNVNFFSKSLAINTNMTVIMPQDTGDEKIPVLYLLHGSGDDYTSWLRNTSLDRYLMNKRLAVVMPTTYSYWYADCDSGNYLTYISDELPKIIRDFFPKISDRREDTFIAGNSMGSYGAYKAAFTHSETFGYAASLSGALDIDCVKIWQDVVTKLGGKLRGTDNDTFVPAKRLKESGKELPRLYQWCGFDDFLYEGNILARDILNGLGYKLDYFESDGGHSWEFWDLKIRDVLDWLPIGEK